MTLVRYVLVDGSEQLAALQPGTTVMAAAIENNIRGIDAECGGSMSCATCHVYVDAACLQLLPPASQNELELLDGVAASRESNSRLSCQITATDKIDELTVYVPETQS